jgi:hypothetical protein
MATGKRFLGCRSLRHRENSLIRSVLAHPLSECARAEIRDDRWLRQPATFIRWRPDLRPEDCSLDQLRL